MSAKRSFLFSLAVPVLLAAGCAPPVRRPLAADPPLAKQMTEEPKQPGEYFTFRSNGDRTLYFSSEIGRVRSLRIFDQAVNLTSEFALPPGFFLADKSISISDSGELIALAVTSDESSSISIARPSELWVVSTKDGSIVTPEPASEQRAFYRPEFTADEKAVVYWATVDHLPNWLFDPPRSPSNNVTLFRFDLVTGQEKLALLENQNVFDGEREGCRSTDHLPIVVGSSVVFDLTDPSGVSLTLPFGKLEPRNITCVGGRLIAVRGARNSGLFGAPLPDREIIQLLLGSEAKIGRTISRPDDVLSNANFLEAKLSGDQVWRFENTFWFVRPGGAIRKLTLAESEYPQFIPSKETIVYVHRALNEDQPRIAFWDNQGRMLSNNAIPQPTTTFALTKPTH